MVRVTQLIRARESDSTKERELLPGALVAVSSTRGSKVTLQNRYGSTVEIPTRDLKEKCEEVNA